MGVDVQAGSQLLASPPDASELMETEYTPYHLLAMRLLDDDASWLTRGCVGVGAETSGVVVVADVEEDVVLAPNGGAVDADTDANAEIVPGGTAAGLLNESNKDTIESSLEDWKLRGYVSGPEAGAEGGADGDRKRGRTRMRTRKSHIREAAVVGLSSQSDDGKNEKAKVKQDKEKKVEKPRETLTKWVGLRDEWRGILSYDGLMMLGKLASGPDASVDDAAAHADVAA
ncbi:hypothetical protein CPB83DRAFT_860772 [Crepidotus variabilis]|uniref:Uncharacterized protein n=1 Tax=Crepidotus variabilis TaxID=179855 RepID=A0A9P6E929_9AGAR|nr:hypothetical protein CPB83DRAFT_860772 [Crepidotus variabilis]